MTEIDKLDRDLDAVIDLLSNRRSRSDLDRKDLALLYQAQSELDIAKAVQANHVVRAMIVSSAQGKLSYVLGQDNSQSSFERATAYRV